MVNKVKRVSSSNDDSTILLFDVHGGLFLLLTQSWSSTDTPFTPHCPLTLPEDHAGAAGVYPAPSLPVVGEVGAAKCCLASIKTGGEADRRQDGYY